MNRGAAKVGEGCYVTATVNNKRYYGLLVEKDALKAASLMHYQDEAAGLDLNRRMKVLSDQQMIGDGLSVHKDIDSRIEERDRDCVCICFFVFGAV